MSTESTVEWVNTTAKQLSLNQSDAKATQYTCNEHVYGYTIFALMYIPLLLYTSSVETAVTQYANTHAAERKSLLGKRKKCVYYVLMNSIFGGIYGYLCVWWGIVFSCVFDQHEESGCHPVGNIILVMFIANGAAGYIILLIYCTRQLKLTKQVMNFIILEWILYMAVNTLVFTMPWTIYKIYSMCACKCLKIQYKYASKVYVKFWNSSEPTDNSCITCHNHLNHPSGAITNELPTRCCRSRRQRGVVALLQRSTARLIPDDADTAVTLCGHLYHVSCLKACLNVNHLCPMCRCKTELTSCYFILKNPAQQEAESDDDSEAIDMDGMGEPVGNDDVAGDESSVHINDSVDA